MRRMLRWMTVAVLCCAATAVAEETDLDTRLQQARTADDEAITLSEAGQYARAEPLFQRALALREAALGKEHPTVANPLHNLALLHRACARSAHPR